MRLVKLVITQWRDERRHGVRDRLHDRVGPAMRDEHGRALKERELGKVRSQQYVWRERAELPGGRELGRRRDELDRTRGDRVDHAAKQRRLIADLAAERYVDERTRRVEPVP